MGIGTGKIGAGHPVVVPRPFHPPQRGRRLLSLGETLPFLEGVAVNFESKVGPANPGPDKPTSGSPLPSALPAPNPGPPAAPKQEILVPVDFSEHSNVALKYAIRFAHLVGARITLLHVLEMPAITPDSGDWSPEGGGVDEIVRAAEQTVTGLCQREKLRPPSMGPTIVRMGVPSEVIQETARDLKSDLIIIATHGRTGLAHALRGSQAEKMIRQSPCPVLVLRAH
jgi:nucleotide-binding universal stress UspA family protein